MYNKFKYWLWLKRCKSFVDVARWLEHNFEYDISRLRESRVRVANGLSRIKSRSPEETFKLKTGICYESSVFSKYSLNKINPEYKAEIVYVCIRRDISSHVVCSFYVDEQMFVIDFGRLIKEYNGIFGPFKDVADYANHYITTHPVFNDYEFCQVGWPSWRSFEPW